MKYPHEGACAQCAAERVCNACGAEIAADRARCTNGRCARCHQAHCTPGGSKGPGHGFWSGRVHVHPHSEFPDQAKVRAN